MDMKKKRKNPAEIVMLIKKQRRAAKRPALFHRIGYRHK